MSMAEMKIDLQTVLEYGRPYDRWDIHVLEKPVLAEPLSRRFKVKAGDHRWALMVQTLEAGTTKAPNGSLKDDLSSLGITGSRSDHLNLSVPGGVLKAFSTGGKGVLVPSVSTQNLKQIMNMPGVARIDVLSTSMNIYQLKSSVERVIAGYPMQRVP